jgi:PAS domain S-box-containing protein
LRASRRAHPLVPRTKLAAILASTNDAIIGSTQDGVITRWNPAAAGLYGYAAQQIIGRNTQILVALQRRPEEARFAQQALAVVPIASHRPR